jgi:hypothetical protein
MQILPAGDERKKGRYHFVEANVNQLTESGKVAATNGYATAR